MMASETTEVQPGEITILGLFAAVAEAWKWFLIIPVAAAVAVYLLIGQIGSDYRSSAILRISDMSALLTSPNVLRPTIERLELQSELGSSMNAATNRLARRLSTRLLTPELTEVALVWPTAEGAQATLQAIIDQFAQRVAPRGGDRERIERQIAAAQQTVAQLRDYAETLAADTPAATQTPAASNDATLGYVALVNEIQIKENEIARLERLLVGFGPEDIVQEPTLSDQALDDNRAIFAVLAAIAAGLFVLFVVLVREAVRRAPADPQSAADLSRIRNAFRFR